MSRRLVGEHREHLGARSSPSSVERHAAAHDGLALALAGEPQQDARADLLPLGSSRSYAPSASRATAPCTPPDALVVARRSVRPSRCCHSSSSAVESSGSAPARPRRRRQRVGQVGLDLQPGATRGQLDRAAQLVAAHRPDGRLVGAEQPPQLRVGGAAAVEVRADGDEHDRPPARVARASDQGVHERRALALVAAGGEDLLELVDGERRAAREPAAGAASRARAADARPAAAALSAQRLAARAARRRRSAGEQAGAQRRRLAAARRPDDAQQRRAGQPGDHLGHEPLAPEEELARPRRRTHARPLNGQTTTPSAVGRTRSLRSRAACSSTTSPASSSSAARSPARSAPCGRRRRRGGGAASARAHSRAAAWTRARHAAAVRDAATSTGTSASARRVERARPPRRRRRRAAPSAARRVARAAARGRASRVARTRTGSAPRPSASSRTAAARLAGAVDVVEHEQRRPRAAAARAITARAAAGVAGAGGVEHGGAVALHLGRQLGDQPRLADPAAPATRTTRPAPPCARASARAATSSSASRPTSGVPASSSGGSCALGAGGSSAGSWRRIASCSSRSSGPGSTPICSTSAARAVAVGLQRVCLAAGAVEREHPLRVQPLAQRVSATSASSSASTSRWRPAARSRVDRELGRPQAQLLEAADLGGRERLARRRRRAARRATARAPRAAAVGRRAARSAARRRSPSPRRNSYPRPRVTISAPSPPAASALRSCET